jgi:carbon-monoxide dehydrogenase small subunit
MTIKFKLNGSDEEIKVEPTTRLLDILRSHYKLMGAKAGCLSGFCGSCIVTLNGAIVSSCLIPALSVRGSEIITIEGFRQLDEYQDIAQGFEKAHCTCCENCAAGKILITDILLAKNRPFALTKEALLAAFDGIKCRCTDPVTLETGVREAAEIRKRRQYGRGS